MRVDLDPVAPEGLPRLQARARERPARSACIGDDHRRLVRAAVGRLVLHADQGCLRAAEIAPQVDQLEARAMTVDAPEEVVRRQEHQVPAEIAVPLDDVVGVPGDVLLMAGEDDQVVRTAQRVAVWKSPRDPRRRRSPPACRCARASAGTRGRSCGTGTARRGSDAAASRRRPSSPTRRTSCHRSRRRRAS